MTKAGVRPLRTGLAALALALATLLLYAPVAGNAFVDYDDGSYVTKNPDVLAGLTREGVTWAFTRTHSSNWHPLTWLAHMLDVELFGLDAGKHHLVNAGLHALNAGLLVVALVALTRRFWPCVVVAALFAVHPLRVESVAWASERKDVLSATFFFLALIAHAAFVRRPSPERRLAVAAAMVLGLLAKPMLVTLPFVLLLLDRWPLGRKAPFAWLVREKLPLVFLAFLSCIATVIAQHLGNAIRSVESLPLDVRLANAVVAYAAYLWKTLWPSGLAIFYPHPALVDAQAYSTAGAKVLGSLVLLALLTGLAVLQRRRRPWLLAGWLWFLGMLVPVIGIVQVGAQWMADRYAYLPLIGIYMAVVWTLDERVRTPRARRNLVAAGLLVAVALMPVTRGQIGTWKDTRTLFERALAVTEKNYVAHINLGFLEHNLGDLDAARAHYEAALAITPTMVDALSNLGGLYWQRTEYDRAEEYFERAIAVDPQFTQAWLGLGLVHRDRGDPDRALEAFRAAVRGDPDSAAARRALAAQLRATGAVAEAVSTIEEAVRRHPQDAAARLGLAKALVDAGRPGEALRHLTRLARADSPALTALELQAWVLATTSDVALRDPDEALRIATGCSERSGGAWSSLRVLAAALAANGRFPEAAGLALEAAAAAPEERQAELLEMRARFAAGEALEE